MNTLFDYVALVRWTEQYLPPGHHDRDKYIGVQADTFLDSHHQCEIILQNSPNQRGPGIVNLKGFRLVEVQPRRKAGEFFPPVALAPLEVVTVNLLNRSYVYTIYFDHPDGQEGSAQVRLTRPWTNPMDDATVVFGFGHPQIKRVHLEGFLPAEPSP